MNKQIASVMWGLSLPLTTSYFICKTAMKIMIFALLLSKSHCEDFLDFFLSLFIYFEEESAEREGERESQAGFVLSTQSPIAGISLTNGEIMT